MRASVPKRIINLDEFMLASMLLLLCLQNLTLFSVGQAQFKASHLFFVAFLLYVALRVRDGFSFTPSRINVLFAVAVFVSLLASFSSGFHSLIFNYIFMFALMVAVYNLCRFVTAERALTLIRGIAWVMLLLVLINSIMQADSFAAFLNNPWTGHPVINTVFSGGGVNLEASWIAMFLVFFDRNKSGVCYSLFCFAISLAYASRAGLLICCLAAIYVFALKQGNKHLCIRLMLVLVLAIVFVVGVSSMNIPAVERLTTIGADRGSIGRLSMWSNVFQTFLASPIIGFGAGGAVDALRQTTGLFTYDENIHNYYLQVLLDFGLVGFILFAVSIARFVFSNSRQAFISPFAAYVLIYLIAAFVQFRGGDALVGFALAGYYQYFEFFARQSKVMVNGTELRKETDG